MKQKLFSILALLLMAATGAWAEEQVVYTLDGTQTASNNNYATAGVVNQGGITWKVTGNVSMNPWRIGGKSISGVDRSIWSESSLDETVTKVTLEFGTASSITVNSITMMVAGDVDFNNVIDSKPVTFSANNTVDVTPTEGKEWKNAYYRFVFNVTVSGSSNKYFQLKSIKFYNDPDAQQQGGSTEPVAGTFTVSLKEGTVDAGNWSIEPKEGLSEGDQVTIQYNGRLKVKGVKATSDAAPAEQAVTTATPLTMECLSDGTIVVDMGSGTLSTGMQYAVNGSTKTTITTTTTIEGLTTGDKVQFYGVGTSTQAYGDSPVVKIAGGTAQVKVYGNIMSLLDEENFATKTDLPSSSFVFDGLFHGNDKLTDASGLLLPATTLANYCYRNMFYDCTALTAAPTLPATTLAEGCYNYIFRGCTALTAAPELPATTLAQSCYTSMFYGCTALTAAPELPATTLANYCYNGMFRGCTALTAAPELPATTLVNYCYNTMFYNCSKLASVTCKATDISATQCLNGWLEDAGTDESVTSRTLYVDPTMVSNTGWNNAGFTVTGL